MDLFCFFRLMNCIILIEFVFCDKKTIFYDTNFDGLLAAFGDFDSDRFTDVFYITDHGRTLGILKSFEQEPVLREWIKVPCSFNGHLINGVIPADFNGDAIMDLMIITHMPENPLKTIWVLRGNKTNVECSEKAVLDDAIDHPFILDFNGDMITDFFVETEKCRRQLWSYSINNKNFKENCIASTSASPMRVPNSNAFVNIQNCLLSSLDYSTDIVITAQDKIEYWINRGGFNIENTAFISYPDETRFKIGQSTFIDLNIDGCIEHLIPACEGKWINCQPQVLWYNNENHDWTNIADFSNQTDLYFDFENAKSNFHSELPVTIRSGDIDGDGYVDLITVMRNKTRGNKIAVILRNVFDSNLPGNRKFIVFWTSENLINDNVELASFLDLQENGKPDIIMTVQDDEKNYHIQWVKNTYMENSCFLKVLVTSGLCSQICPNERVPYGTNQPGPFVCYETSDVNGHTIKGCAAQLSQSAHFALQMPYSIFGLGQTPNFVESVTASIPSGEISARKSRWTQIVPDAQVVLIPFPPNETAYWISKLFYTPSNIVFSTLITLSILCAALVVIILILHRKEVLEDLAEHEEYKRHWPESR